MQRLFEHLTVSFCYSTQYELGRKAVLIWCFLNMAVMMLDFDLFWGSANLVPATHEIVSWKTYLVFDLLHSLDPSSPWRWGLATLYLMVLAGGIVSRYAHLFSIPIWVLAHTFLISNNFIADGGDRLVLQMLNYILIADLATIIPWAALRNTIRNLSVLSIMLQICLIYLATSISKLSGQHWTTGTAVYYIMSIDEYTIPAAAAFARELPMLTVAMTYIVLLHQLSFTFLIIHPGARSIMLTLGGVIHIGIAILTGIASFGIAMTISYLFFLSDDRAIQMSNAFSRLSRRILVLKHEFFKISRQTL